MPYCPKCLIEYVEGTPQCEDCGAFLVPGAPPEEPLSIDLAHERDVKLVPVRVFTGGTAQMDADLARNLLRVKGIPSLPSGEGAAELLPVLDVRLLVREEDLDNAARVLEEFLDTDLPPIAEESDSTPRS